MRSDCYNHSSCCNAHCDFENEKELCWGYVDLVDEIQLEDDHRWVHACRGHQEVCYGGAYLSKVLKK